MADPPLLEAVPNFSEGRRPLVLDALREAARGVHVLDLDQDPDHNRAVLTLASGDGEALLESLLRTVAVAVEKIDLTRQRGVHPRVGSADVIPLVPLGSASVEICVGIARRLASRIWTELRVPVYLYGLAASSPERSRLATIRAGRLRPDLGAEPTARSGACSVGVRPPLVAYNVLLESADLSQGQALARRVRESSGGLKGVQALAFLLGGGRVQLSMNLFDLSSAPPAFVLAQVARFAADLGLRLGKDQVVGLCPAQVATAAANGRILEGRLAAAAARASAAVCRGRADQERQALAGRLEKEAEALAALDSDPTQLLIGAERTAALARVLNAAGCLQGDLGSALLVAARGLRAAAPSDAGHEERLAALDRWLKKGWPVNPPAGPASEQQST